MTWTEQTVTFDYLQREANSSNDYGSMVRWLQNIGVIPLNVNFTRPNRLPKLNLDPNAIPAEYLAEFAVDFDNEGASSPREMVAALAFEVRGTPQKVNVAEIMDGLTAGSYA